ncbi:hypothetical protein [Polyangium spumosum]|uniref:Uncharacterized protein n=1 Tax=Polyangium spumosum TaxID=889282 RepID=A0A6N7PV17_9BACT|nr:hypothetical protein [Polyangium spumosum]MRG95833.1 hypothetical protein [Polyangium spumosum]
MRIGIGWKMLVFGTLLGLAACGGDEAPPPPPTGGAGGAGGEGPSPPPARCGELCDHVAQINCFVWSKCADDCAAYLGAEEACEGAFEALLGCWADQKADFACIPSQVVPPAACKAEEEAFRACAQGQTRPETSACVGQSCTSGSHVCSCSTTCAAVGEMRSACTMRADGTWQCACRENQSLRGTCEEPKGACDNQEGCCAAFFY